MSFTDQVIGVYPTGYMDAETSVDDLYVEFLVPLLADKTGFQALELEIGARTSDYEHTDQEDTYKFLLNWEVNDWVRFRGGFNRATRAPNIGELFLNVQEIFQVGGNNFGDPCGLRSTSPFGAGGTGPDPVLAPTESQPQIASGQTPQGAASTRMIARPLMGPTAANQFYNVADAPAAGGAAFNWVNQRGNSGLTSETADSITFGFVMNSPFDGPWLANTTLSWTTTGSKSRTRSCCSRSTTRTSVATARRSSASTAEAAARAASPECQLTPRNLALADR